MVRFCILVGKPTNWFLPTFSNTSFFRAPISGGNSVILLPNKYSSSSLFSFCILVGKLISLLSLTESTISSLRSLITGGSSFIWLPSKCSSLRFFRFCILEGKSIKWFLLSTLCKIVCWAINPGGNLNFSKVAAKLLNSLLTLSTLSSFKSPISSGSFFSLLLSTRSHWSLSIFCILVGKQAKWFLLTVSTVRSFRSPISEGSSVSWLLSNSRIPSLFSFCILVGNTNNLLLFNLRCVSSFRSKISAGSSTRRFVLKSSFSSFISFCIVAGILTILNSCLRSTSAKATTTGATIRVSISFFTLRSRE